MRTATRRLEAVPVDQIAEHAAQVRPGHVAATVITALFFALGWVVGASWRAAVFLTLLTWHRGIVYCYVAVRYGYRQGAHIPVTLTLPEQPRGRPGPGGTFIEE